MTRPPVMTVGYEAQPQAAVIDRLREARVELVVDVRAIAASRRAGFSKTLLAASLAEAGIGYLHLRDLGTPKRGRDFARAGKVAEMHAVFAEHMETPAAELAFQHLREVAGERRVALLCYEAEACGCHRAILSARLARETGAEVVDL